MPAFGRVSVVPTNVPGLSGGPEERRWAIEYCEAARRSGVGEVQVNFLSLPVHPILMEDPARVYHWFSNYAASLDMFAFSKLFRGVYPVAIISANFERMRVLSQEAVRHGLKPFMYCAEPRFVPERFFRTRADLRGPRVDNPAFGGGPCYSLCVDLEEVREHYRQMLAAIMTRLPELTTLSLFTTDSGSGFCHCPELYAGPNGPRHCRDIPFVDRIVKFCRDLIETGRKYNDDFEVHLNSNLPVDIRAEIALKKVEGLCLPVYGRYSWTGGLDDQWAYHQYGSEIESVGYERARKERADDIRRRVEAASVNEKRPWAICELPTCQYSTPIRYVPRPYEILQMLRTYRRLGVKNLSFRGIVNHPRQLGYDVNADVFRTFQECPDKEDQAIVAAVLETWNVPSAGESLREAWALADEAVRQKPLWNHSFGRTMHLLVGPIVPDFSRLRADQIAYYDHVCFDESDLIRGKLWYLPDLGPPGEYEYAIAKYEGHTLALLERACSILRAAADSACDKREQDILTEQLRHLELNHSHLTSQYHWVQMAHLQRGGSLDITAEGLIDREIDNTRRFIALLDNDPQKYLDIAPLEGYFYTLGPAVIDKLRSRIRVMADHRSDPVARL